MNVVILIPARYGSSRYPGKPLVNLKGAGGVGKPLIQRSVEAARRVAGVSGVFVTTDDERIADANGLDPLTEHARPERVQIQLDVGQFGHTAGVPRRACGLQCLQGRSLSHCSRIHGCASRYSRRDDDATTRRPAAAPFAQRGTKNTKFTEVTGHVSTALPVDADVGPAGRRWQE